MHHHFNHTTKGRKIMRKSAVQISLWDIYNGVSEAIEQHKPQLIRLLEEHIDFDRLILTNQGAKFLKLCLRCIFLSINPKQDALLLIWFGALLQLFNNAINYVGIHVIYVK